MNKKHKKSDKKLKIKIGKNIKRSSLVHLYKIIKSEPFKIWRATDFSGSYYYNVKTYLQTLLELGLIQKEEVTLSNGGKYKCHRTVGGFKLKTSIQDWDEWFKLRNDFIKNPWRKL